jgi:hypothetical protein
MADGGRRTVQMEEERGALERYNKTLVRALSKASVATFNLCVPFTVRGPPVPAHCLPLPAA